MDCFAKDVWTASRPQRFFGIQTGTKMTVVRLRGGGLFVHSPVALDEATREQVQALGTVEFVVCPCLFHHLYVGQWQQAFPNAVFCASPGLEKKRADIRWDCMLANDPEERWGGDLEQVYMSGRFEKEVVFFHVHSQTLICADALLNLSTHPSRMTRLVAALMRNDAPGKGWLERVFAVRDRMACRDEVQRMLQWDIDKIVLAHGEPVQANGREVLRDGYDWVLDP